VQAALGDGGVPGPYKRAKSCSRFFCENNFRIVSKLDIATLIITNTALIVSNSNHAVFSMWQVRAQHPNLSVCVGEAVP
jgi:hypothetical protein